MSERSGVPESVELEEVELSDMAGGCCGLPESRRREEEEEGDGEDK